MSGPAARRRPVDVLVLRCASTPGHRSSEAELCSGLRSVGVDVASTTARYGLLGRLRVAQPLIDLIEAVALRQATTRAMRTVAPRAIIYPTTLSTIFEPASRLRIGAVRFDALARDNRRARRNILQRQLERRSLALAKLLLPWGARSIPLALPGHAGPPALVLPPPVEGAGFSAGLPARPPAGGAVQEPAEGRAEEPVGGPEGEPADAAGCGPGARDPVVVCYAGNPAKKGLDLVVGAWWRASPPPRWRLVVTGIDGRAGDRYLRRHGLARPAALSWRGPVAPDEHRRLLSEAEVVVAASRYEDFGISQLEALAAGAVLVTVPSGGPFEALGLARQLSPGLVATAISADGLALALRRALAMTGAERGAYRARAAQLVSGYSRDAFLERLQREVLPTLLGEGGVPGGWTRGRRRGAGRGPAGA
ncbi:MAG: glycosyltransferase [Acidimicrobiales bacterium]